jgi:hypothetical protein
LANQKDYLKSVKDILTTTFDLKNDYLNDYFKKYQSPYLISDGSNPYLNVTEVYESKEDLLALSCAWYRIRNKLFIDKDKVNTNLLIATITDKNLYENVLQEDREHALKIRDYYSKKIMMLKLKEKNLTKFREDLNNFIHTDGKIFKNEIIGMAYRLPEFYEYDTLLDRIFSRHNKIVSDDVYPNPIEKELKLIDFSVRNVSKFKRLEYWFTDNFDNVVNVYLDYNNPLINIWEKIIEKPITLKGYFFKKSKDDCEFYVVERYTIVE